MHLGAARCGCDRGWERVGVSPEVHGAREEASERAEGAIRGAMEGERDGHVLSRRSKVSAPATTAPARARRAAQPHGAGTQDVGWIDNTTISHAGAHGARFGGACGICRAHSPAKGTGVATADDMAAACMLLSQTRATTGGRRSLQWVLPQVVSRVSGEGFFLVFWRSRDEVPHSSQSEAADFAVRSGMIFHRCGPYESETS